MDFTFLEFILCGLLNPEWLIRLFMVTGCILWGQFLIELYGFATRSATRQQAQPNQPTTNPRSILLPQDKSDRPSTQNKIGATIFPAETRHEISTTLRQKPEAQQQGIDWKTAYNADLKRTNISLTEALENAADMRKELKRQLEEKDNQLRMAEQQEEENENTQKQLTALLIQTTNELNRTRNILRRLSTVQAVSPNDPAMMTESTASNAEVHMSEQVQTEDILVLDVPEREPTVLATIPFTIEFEKRNQEFVDTDYIKASVPDLIRGFEKKNQEFVNTDSIKASVADLITEAVNEPAIEMNVQSETDGTKAIASRPVKRVTFATEVEEIPRKSSKVSRFIERMDAQLVKQGFLIESDANITASIQVKMNEQPVEMVIDDGCFESIISQDLWRQLGEPELKPLTKDDLITLKRTGKYKKRVTLEQIGGYFHAIVKLQEKVMVLPVYVCAKDKIMPNFLGRRLFHDLHLQKENAYLVQFTRTNETGSLLTTGSTTQPESEETDKMENPVTEQDTQTDLTEALTTLLRVLNEKSKEKDQKKRDKYEKWMYELIEYNIELKYREMAELVDTMSSKTKSEPNVH